MTDLPRMKFRRRILYALRGKITNLAHHPRVINTKWHDRLEFVAYRMIDPLIWL